MQSSEYEGTPNVVLEAMAMETPVIATDVGGTRELVTSGVHGIIVPQERPAGAHRGDRKPLSESSDARARATAARHRVEAELSFDARTRRLEAIYEDLIRERDRARGPSGATSSADA